MKTDTAIETPVINTAPNKVQPLVKLNKGLQEKAIRIKLTIANFGGNKRDKKASEEVTNDKNATKGSASVVKKVMHSDQLKKVGSLATDTRNYFRQKSLPWDREGEGVVPIKTYMEVKMELEKRKREFDEAVDKLIADYDKIKDADKSRLGGLYNEKDYPSSASFRSKFYIEIDVLPLERSDFRCNALDDAQVAEINKRIEERNIEAEKAARKDLLIRIQERLENLYGRLADSEGRFHKSNFTNLFETLDDVNDLNISEDADIDRLVKGIAQTMVKHNADSVKSSEKSRSEAMSDTKAQLEQINNTMKNFF